MHLDNFRVMCLSHIICLLSIIILLQFIGNITNYISDAQFLYPELKMVEKVASKLKSSIYFYLFGYGGTVLNNKNVGVGHAAEIKYIFQEGSLTAIEKSVSELMIELWTSFATNG